MSDTETLALADLARSGISPDDAISCDLGVTDNAAEDVHPSLGAEVRGLVFPYFNPDRTPLLGDDGLPYRRIRVLGEPPISAPLGFAKAKKPPKYLQGKGTGVHPYLTPFVPWDQIFADPNIPIIITEGEKKAIAACAHGFATIGLGGVHNFLNDRKFLPLLASCQWRNRIVYIIFDSDAATNPMVRDAEAKLTTELSTGRHADVRVVRLPPKESGVDLEGNKLPAEKVALDDYLLVHGVGPLRELMDRADSMSKLDREVAAMNNEVAWISVDKALYLLAEDRFIDRDAFTNGEEFSARRIPRIGMSKKGPVDLPPYEVAKEWLKHKNARRYSDVVFRPGADRIIAEDNRLLYNTWRGIPSEEGDVSLFLAANELLFSEVEEEHRDFPLKLMAYKAQNPGTKAPIAIVLVGQEGGGKGLWSRMIASAFAPHSQTMEATAVKSDFNAYVERNLIVVLNEMQGDVLRDVAPKLRSYIADPYITLRTMYRNPRQVHSLASYIITANDHAAASFGDDDRRFFIVQTPPLNPALGDFYSEAYDWVNNRNGGRAIMHYLLNYDLKGWKPPVKAPLTKEKQIAHEEGLTPITALAQRMKEAGGPNIVYQWIASSLAWKDEMKANMPANAPNSLYARLRDIETILPLMTVRPFYTAKELNLIFPYLMEALGGYRGGDAKMLTPQRLSRVLRNAGIRTLMPADDPRGFMWLNERQHFLIIADVNNPDLKKPLTQDEFARMMMTFPTYAELSARGTRS